MARRKRSVEFMIPYPNTTRERRQWSARYGLNAIYAGKHWAERKSDRDFWHWLVAAELKRQKIPQRVFERPVGISFFWDDRLDVDNHAYMGKLIVDAIKGRFIVDDDRRFVRSVLHTFRDDADEILVRIEEI